MNANYQTMFENLQNMKMVLFTQDKLDNYYEDDTYFYIKNTKSDDFKLRKQKYIYKNKKIDTLTINIQKLNKKILSMQKLYVTSISNLYEEELKELFKQRNEKLTQLILELESKKNNPNILFERIDKNEISPVIDVGLLLDNDKQTAKPLSKSVEKKEKIIKKFLFENYQQCISLKTSEPTYMTKDSIIKHVKKYYPGIVLPKNINAMKKGEICKIIFE